MVDNGKSHIWFVEGEDRKVLNTFYELQNKAGITRLDLAESKPWKLYVHFDKQEGPESMILDPALTVTRNTEKKTYPYFIDNEKAHFIYKWKRTDVNEERQSFKEYIEDLDDLAALMEVKALIKDKEAALGGKKEKKKKE